jgi:hypothetical protein
MQEVSFTALLMQETRRRKIVHMGVNTRSCAKNLVFRISTLENARCQTGHAIFWHAGCMPKTRVLAQPVLPPQIDDFPPA